MAEFKSFPKIPRYSRDIIITEKIDGTNAQIYILENKSLYSTEFKEHPSSLRGLFFNDSYFNIFAGSRNRWITTDNDNFGFAKWVKDNAEELIKLGHGRHFGEWWGKGIQRGYGLDHKRFSLFNVQRWNKDNVPECVNVVPIIYKGPWTLTDEFDWVHGTEEMYPAVGFAMNYLKQQGSLCAPGYDNPEGIIIFHTGKVDGVLFKKTFEKDMFGKTPEEDK